MFWNSQYFNNDSIKHFLMILLSLYINKDMLFGDKKTEEDRGIIWRFSVL